MSATIRSYIRSVLLETMRNEVFPPTPSDIKLDEGPPPAPDDVSTGSKPAGAEGRQVPAEPAPPAPGVDPKLVEYLNAAVDFLVTNDIEIGLAADYLVDSVTGFISPDEIMVIYENAKAVDIRFGQHDADGNARNWTVLLLGCALHTILGQSLLNFLPQVVVESERLIVKAAESASDAGGLQEWVTSNKKQLLREATFGGLILRALDSDLASMSGKITSALEAEARSAAKTATNVAELDNMLNGVPIDKFGTSTLADYVQDSAVSTIRSTLLGDLGQSWSRAATRDLTSGGITSPTINDLIEPGLRSGVPLSTEAQAAADTISRQIRTIKLKPDDEIYAAVKKGDTTFRDGEVRATVKAKEKATTATGSSAAGALGSVGTGIDAMNKIIGGLGLTGIVGAVAFANWIDNEVDTRVNPDLIASVRLIATAAVPNNEKITSMDIALTQMQLKSGNFATTRSRINRACQEYWVDNPDCADFQNILLRGPYNVGMSNRQ